MVSSRRGFLQQLNYFEISICGMSLNIKSMHKGQTDDHSMTVDFSISVLSSRSVSFIVEKSTLLN